MIKDKDIIKIFNSHDGIPLEVTVKSMKKHIVLNIAWGYDDGDEYSHISTNISPSIDGYDFDFFYSNEILKIYNTKNKETVFEL